MPWFDYWDSGPYWDWPGYGYYGYPGDYDLNYDYGNYDNGPSSYDSAPPENYPADNQGVPATQSAPQTVNPGDSAGPVLIYMKDGSVYSASSYWVADGKLHFIFLSGVESSVDMDRLDIQRTIDVNAKSGVPFTLKPDPNNLKPAPDTNSVPPASTPSPAPAPRFNLTSQPQV